MKRPLIVTFYLFYYAAALSVFTDGCFVCVFRPVVFLRV